MREGVCVCVRGGGEEMDVGKMRPLSPWQLRWSLATYASFLSEYRRA